MSNLSRVERRSFCALVVVICACGLLLLVGFALLCVGCREVFGGRGADDEVWMVEEAAAALPCGAACRVGSRPGDYPEVLVEMVEAVEAVEAVE